MKQETWVKILAAGAIIVFVVFIFSMAVNGERERDKGTKVYHSTTDLNIAAVKMAEMIRASQLNDGVIDSSALTAVREFESAIRSLDTLLTEKERVDKPTIGLSYFEHYVPKELEYHNPPLLFREEIPFIIYDHGPSMSPQEKAKIVKSLYYKGINNGDSVFIFKGQSIYRGTVYATVVNDLIGTNRLQIWEDVYFNTTMKESLIRASRNLYGVNWNIIEVR